MKGFWLLLGGVGLAAGGFFLGRQVTQNAVTRHAAALAAAAGIKPGTVIATPAGVGVVK